MRAIDEWIGRNSDSAIPPRVRLRIWDKHYGHCSVCERKIMSGEKWDCDHRIALINGGEHREHNLRLICAWCHTKKTTEDVAEKSMISKRRKKHLGIKKPTGFRGWRRMDGTVVWNRHKR